MERLWAGAGALSDTAAERGTGLDRTGAHSGLGADSWLCANLCGVSHSTVKRTLSFGASSPLKGQRHCLFPKVSLRLKPAQKEQTRGIARRDQGAVGPDAEGQAVTLTLPPGSPGVWPLKSAVGLGRQPVLLWPRLTGIPSSPAPWQPPSSRALSASCRCPCARTPLSAWQDGQRAALPMPAPRSGPSALCPGLPGVH